MNFIKIVKQVIVYFIRFISKLFRLNNLRACRFYPSCSEYSVEAFQKMKAPRAFYLMARRVLSCHPFSEGGYDPLPKTNSTSPFSGPVGQARLPFGGDSLN